MAAVSRLEGSATWSLELAGLHAVLERLHSGHELGRREVAVLLALHEGLAQEVLVARPADEAVVVVLLLHRDELVRDRIGTVQLRHLEVDGGHRGLLQPADRPVAGADVGAARQRLEVVAKAQAGRLVQGVDLGVVGGVGQHLGEVDTDVPTAVAARPR